MQIEKTRILFEQVGRTGQGSGSDASKITLNFVFFIVDMNGDLGNSTYYLNAGVEYGGQSYVWVGQVPITTVIVPQVRKTIESRRMYVPIEHFILDL